MRSQFSLIILLILKLAGDSVWCLNDDVEINTNSNGQIQIQQSNDDVINDNNENDNTANENTDTNNNNNDDGDDNNNSANNNNSNNYENQDNRAIKNGPFDIKTLLDGSKDSIISQKVIETLQRQRNPPQPLSSIKNYASNITGLPTRYHYYPHNQHMYLLPECAIQQVCNAVYLRLNTSQPLCACPSRFRDPCSASLNEDDQHTTKLIGKRNKKAITLAKTCETISEVKTCTSPNDWSLLALQNIRTGKSHFLLICRCPEKSRLDGPVVHDQPLYASLPGIRVYGMICTKPDGHRGGGD